MAECKCRFKSRETGNVVMILTEDCDVHRDVTEEATFAVRAWIVTQGLIYNSYRDDTGTDTKKALPVYADAYHDNAFCCPLSDYLEQEEEGVVVGLSLFVDGVLTSVQANVVFEKPAPVDDSLLHARLKDAVALSLQERGMEDEVAVASSVQSGMKERGWLPYFSSIEPSQAGEEGGWTVIGGLSAKFDKAFDEEILSFREHCKAQEREEKMSKLDAMQQAEAEAEFAREQVELLQNRVSELEALRKSERREFQTQLADLRLQLQLSKQEGSDAKEWVCRTCTFLNPIANSACSMCSVEKNAVRNDEEKHD